MTCPIDARLAAAASGEDADALSHASACVRCRALLADQRAVIAAARRWVPLVMRPGRRAALAAEVMARSDFGPQRWRDTRVLVAASLVAAAAVAVFVATGVREARAPSWPDLATAEEPPIEVVQRASIDSVPRATPGPRRAEIVASDADFARERHDQQDLVTLRDGALAIDARDREPVTIVAGDTRVTVAKSRVAVVARAGVIITAQAFAGSVEITSGDKHAVIDAGMVWTREAPAEPAVAGPTASLAAFRAGWQALRDKHYADAIAAFDRAADPVVAEDASFWAAIASERAGDRDDAAARLRAFLARFPSSPRIESARGALDRVTH